MTFHDAIDCTVDNNHLKKIWKTCIGYFPSLYKAKFSFNHNGLVLPAVHVWDVPQVVHSI